MPEYKSRRRWLTERWLRARRDQLLALAADLKQRLWPADWAMRCERMARLPDAESTSWQPAAGSSSAELLYWLQPLQSEQRRWLASLLDAPAAGSRTLLEALERQQFDWQARLDPLHSHRDYADQLRRLARMLGLPAVAASAYLENELQLRRAIDLLALESMPLRLRADWARQHVAGEGACIRWWQQQLLARAGLSPETVCVLQADDWPQLPPAWLAVGWLLSLRHAEG